MNDKVTDEQKRPEEEKLIPVGDGAEGFAGTEESEETEEERSETSEESGDERVGHSEDENDDPERQKLREKRRQERKTRRERDRREMNFLRQRNEQMERQLSELVRRQSQHERLTVQGRLSTLEERIQEVDSIYDKAIIAKDEATAAEARKVKAKLQQTKEQLERAVETQVEEERAEPEAQNAPPTITPEMRARFAQARKWMSRNPWFDPNLSDEVSHIVKVMDDRLQAEGEMSAEEPEYWEELDRRVAKRFPELQQSRKKATNVSDPFHEEDEDDLEEERPQRREPQKRKASGPKFSVGGRTRPLKANEVYLDSERRKALEELGAMDDPVLRERYLRAYQTYDRDAARNKN